ncbi:body fluid secretion [Nesidiocoris tenuis]|uniref:Body fluid secretion n=1 Tax=Nesidiocoris tenuis TaxID=355587 RepID=A0ABN7AY44_9HEMI|nr:body fluid secretion [Nesidiocoris tenuis]
MWVKYLWISLVTGAVVAAAVHDAPRELSSADWPLNRFYFPSQHPLIQQDDFEDSWRWKRTGPSLSVSNPIEVLRSRLLLEIARRRMQKDNQQVNTNRQLLTSVGKRQTSPFRTSFRTTDQNPKSPDYFSNNSGDVEWDTS